MAVIRQGSDAYVKFKTEGKLETSVLMLGEDGNGCFNHPYQRSLMLGNKRSGERKHIGKKNTRLPQREERVFSTRVMIRRVLQALP